VHTGLAVITGTEDRQHAALTRGTDANHAYVFTASPNRADLVPGPRPAPEQVMRLARFRQAHPGVMVGAGRGWWQAVIPEPNGEQVIIRYTLGQLLDRLDELIGG
jgi:hypothetical protein